LLAVARSIDRPVFSDCDRRPGDAEETHLVGVSLGIVRSALFIGRFRILSTMTYLLMGWLIVLASKQLMANIAYGGLILLLAGGLAYSVGVVFYAWKKLPYNHPFGTCLSL